MLAKRNLRHEEWNEFVGPNVPYVRTCPDLPSGYGAPAPAYGGPAYAAPQSPMAFHQGMTFEANLGLGYARADANGRTDSSDAIGPGHYRY